ncbi:MAG: peptide deformylase [Prolixibacteraceae bacterium]|jgi:peptide deformylase|nr:peptide deformylase [Prolixibacteraceae bacterium]
MIVPIIKYGSSLLRKHASAITKEDDPEKIANNLYDTLKKEAGLGLAGPQIGLLKRIFVIDTSPLTDDPSVEKTEEAVINPEIIEKSSDTAIYNEGCLSIPGIYKDVKRPEKIRVRYQDVAFNIIEKELDGIQARIFQHEYDHLDGILFIDRLNSIERKLLAGKISKIRKQK